ncbi:MAG: acetyl-CoA carboxylase, carboxyltransferase subunit beta [Clostridium sp.]
MLKDLFKKSYQYATVSKVSLDETLLLTPEEKPIIPDGMWRKCDGCGSIVYNEDIESNNYVCNKCGNHFRIGAKKRIEIISDKDTFEEMFNDFSEGNPLNFKGYSEKLETAKTRSGIDEAVITGVCNIMNIKVAVGVMDSNFMMGSMGKVVGEKLTSLIEYATDNKLPIVIFTTSGGARMQEGIFSLMQMAKISAAIGKHDSAGLLYITVLTDPTTGGVTASFAMEGDIIIAEPKCLVGFAGRRVIENTIKETLPDEFQTAEFLLEKGFIDIIVDRNELKTYIGDILSLHGGNRNE